MRYLIGPVGQPIRQMTDRRTVMYTGKGACCFALLSRGAANRISADGAYHSVRPLHNTPSAASLSRFGLGHVRKHTPFALTLSSLHLGYSAKSLPKKHRFFGERPFCKGLIEEGAAPVVRHSPLDESALYGDQLRPSISPLTMSIFSALGTLGSPGMRMMLPMMTTIISAPVVTTMSLTCISKSLGAPRSGGGSPRALPRCRWGSG